MVVYRLPQPDWPQLPPQRQVSLPPAQGTTQLSPAPGRKHGLMPWPEVAVPVWCHCFCICLDPTWAFIPPNPLLLFRWEFTHCDIVYQSFFLTDRYIELKGSSFRDQQKWSRWRIWTFSNHTMSFHGAENHRGIVTRRSWWNKWWIPEINPTRRLDWADNNTQLWRQWAASGLHHWLPPAGPRCGSSHPK